MGPKRLCHTANHRWPDHRHIWGVQQMYSDPRVRRLSKNNNMSAECCSWWHIPHTHLSCFPGHTISLDNTNKIEKKALVVDKDGAHVRYLKGGILSVLNEDNLIAAWVSGQDETQSAQSLHSVQIYDRNIDNIVTLYCLRHASRRLADYIWYTCYIGQPDNIRYVLPSCLINSMMSACTPPSYIQYPMECDRRTMSDNDDIKW